MYRLSIIVLACALSVATLGQSSSASQSSPIKSDAEILSDIGNVDFGPYLSKAMTTVRANWYALMPAEAKPPRKTSGETIVQFAVLPDGKVDKLILSKSSGNPALDRAAIAAVTSSIPFHQLPSKFKGPSLALRVRFTYNPK